jgi:predicted alpha/beta-hydrolase family hydrolase
MHPTLQAEFFTDEHPDKPAVRGFLHPCPTPKGALVLAHAAAANCDSPLLVALAGEFSAAGIVVLRCDLPFRQLRPKGRPPANFGPRDQAGLRRAVELMKAEVSKTVYLGGHAYGGRQASILAALEPSLVAGLLLLSYPLHPPQQSEPQRTYHFSAVRNPVMFVQASRDPFGTAQEIDAALGKLSAPARVIVVKDARHELLTEQNRETLPRTVVHEFTAFVEHPENV